MNACGWIDHFYIIYKCFEMFRRNHNFGSNFRFCLTAAGPEKVTSLFLQRCRPTKPKDIRVFVSLSVS